MRHNNFFIFLAITAVLVSMCYVTLTAFAVEESDPASSLQIISESSKESSVIESSGSKAESSSKASSSEQESKKESSKEEESKSNSSKEKSQTSSSKSESSKSNTTSSKASSKSSSTTSNTNSSKTSSSKVTSSKSASSEAESSEPIVENAKNVTDYGKLARGWFFFTVFVAVASAALLIYINVNSHRKKKIAEMRARKNRLNARINGSNDDGGIEIDQNFNIGNHYKKKK